MRKTGIFILLGLFILSLISVYAAYPYGISISPQRPEAGETITCTALTAVKGADPSDFTFYWYVNGGTRPVKTENGWHGSFTANAYSTFSGTSGGEFVECVVKNDGGATVAKGSVNVLGGEQPASNNYIVDINPKSATKRDSLKCTLTPETANNFDSSDYTFYWYINSDQGSADYTRPVKTENGWHGSFSEAYSTLTSGFDNGDVVACVVRNDGGAEVGAPYSVKISNVAPVILGPLGMQNVTEGDTISFTIDVFDEDGDDVTLRIVNVAPALVAWANTPTTGTTISGHVFTWTPNNGVVQHMDNSSVIGITVEASDSEATTRMVFYINVTDVNQVPSLENYSAISTYNSWINDPAPIFTVFEDIILNVSFSDIDREDTHNMMWYLNGVNITGSSPTTDWPNRYAWVIIDAFNNISSAGIYNVSVNVMDPYGANFTLPWNIEIIPDIPHLDWTSEVNGVTKPKSINYVINENETITIQFTAADHDNLSVEEFGTNATVGSFNTATGVFNWTPGFDIANQLNPTAVYVIEFNVTESMGNLTDSVTININVTNVNRAPYLNDTLLPLNMLENSYNSSLLDLSLYILDDDMDPLSYFIDNISALDGRDFSDLILTLDNSTGILSANATNHYTGTVNISLRVTDGLDQWTGSLLLNVTNVEDNPELINSSWWTSSNSTPSTGNIIVWEDDTLFINIWGFEWDFKVGQYIASIKFTVEKVGGDIMSWFGEYNGGADTIGELVNWTANQTFAIGDAGNYTINMTMTDSVGNITTDSWNLTVQDTAPYNNAAVPNISINKWGYNDTVEMIDYFADPKNDTLTFSINNSTISNSTAINAEVLNSSTGRLKISSLPNSAVGNYTFNITVNNSLTSIDHIINVEVLPYNYPPEFINQPIEGGIFQLEPGTSMNFTYNLTYYAYDHDNATADLVFGWTNLTPMNNATISIDGNQMVTVTTDTDFNTPFIIQFNVTDGDKWGFSENVTIRNVDLTPPVLNAPIITDISSTEVRIDFTASEDINYTLELSNDNFATILNTSSNSTHSSAHSSAISGLTANITYQYRIYYADTAVPPNNGTPYNGSFTTRATDLGTISGKILNDFGEMWGVQVALVQGAEIKATYTTFDDGEYSFEVYEGMYNLTASSSGFVQNISVLSLLVAGGSVNVSNITLVQSASAGGVYGHVLDFDFAGVQAIVTVYDESTGNPVHSTWTDGAGYFEIYGLETLMGESYKISASNMTGTYSTSTSITGFSPITGQLSGPKYILVQ